MCYQKIFFVKNWPGGTTGQNRVKKELRRSTVEFWRKIFFDSTYVIRCSFWCWFRIWCLFCMKIKFWQSKSRNTSATPESFVIGVTFFSSFGLNLRGSWAFYRSYFTYSLCSFFRSITYISNYSRPEYFMTLFPLKTV